MTQNRTPDPRERMVALNIRIPLNLRRQLRILAAEQGVTMTSVILDLLGGILQEKHFFHDGKRAR